MTGDNPQRDSRDTNGGDNPPADDYEIAVAIKSLEEEYTGAQKERSDHDKKTLFWAKIAGVGVLVYTLLTVFIAAASIYSAYVTKRALLIGQRAFVHFEGVDFPVADKWKADEGCCVFNLPRKEGKIIAPEFALTNAGNTPTKHLKISIQCQPLGVGTQIVDPFELFKISDERIVERSIGAKQTIKISPEQCEIKDDDTLFNAQMNTVRRFLLGKITYEDWIDPGTTHQTRFVHQLVVKELGKAGNGLVGATVTSIPIGKNNCTDDDCPDD